ncbi:MAG TPA: hypothetical protein VGK78_02365 [Nocardioides sp.]|uniref:hypothetical protein n=1 Tax=Nocardioides sp. TaxID=35761 RepID=UPI002F3FEE80
MNPPHQPPSYDEADPFDLPEWLGECEVTWEAERGLATGHRVAGSLTAAGREAVPCDLLAVDDAYPEPVTTDAVRVRTHQVWRHGEVLVAADGPRVLLVVPGSRIDTDTALEALGRLARAVGARPGSYAVRLRVGP